MSSDNPLAGRFRAPKLYVNLPSGGKWWPEGSIQIPANGEIPVYAMRNQDEVALKTPDALMNGAATVQVVHSCMPNVQDAWKMPILDLDYILIAIRIASYGNDMDFTAVCPACKTRNERTAELNQLLDSFRSDIETRVEIDQGLIVNLKPIDYTDFTKLGQKTYEQQKIYQAVLDDQIPEEEKPRIIREGFEKVRALEVDITLGSIESVELTDENITVTDRSHILEYLNMVDSQKFNRIHDVAKKNKENSGTPPLMIKCENEECGHEWENNLTFDLSHFFG